MIVRWGLDALPLVLAEVGSERPLLVTTERWRDLDLEASAWRIPLPGSAGQREHRLTDSAVALLRDRPKLGECTYVLPNLSTRKPYRSLTQSWEVVKDRAHLNHLELDDLRDCNFGEREWDEQLSPILV